MKILKECVILFPAYSKMFPVESSQLFELNRAAHRTIEFVRCGYQEIDVSRDPIFFLTFEKMHPEISFIILILCVINRNDDRSTTVILVERKRNNNSLAVNNN